jgi:enterochelin esterase-like enzyme
MAPPVRMRLKMHCLPLALLASLAVPSSAHAQSPPDPNYQRQQIFSSYQEFKDELTAISGVADPAQRTAQLDALWTQLRNAGQIPYAQGDRTAFLYRGAASSVALAGDFNGWNPGGSSWRAAQLAGTDLWVLEKTLPTDARLDYKFVLGGSNWILDPANSLQIWSGLGGPNSELRMPDYDYPQETVRQAGVARGQLTGNVKVRSTRLNYDVSYRVYTPAGYDAATAQNLPVVYVTDGHEYSADHLGSMVVVLDNLIASGKIQPTMAVFIDPRDPATGANRRMSEYGQNANFAGFVADELAPRIDAAYRTLASPVGRMILGTSLGGLAAAHLGASRSDAFGHAAVQSPASFSQFAPNTLGLYAAPGLADKLDVFVTAGMIGDGSAGSTFAATLANRGFDYSFMQVNEGHSWGNWRGLLDEILVDLVGPTPALAADFNDDGAVDYADLQLWKAGEGKATGALHRDGDADSDRDVDGADFLQWQRQVGAVQTLPATSIVPEPSAASLALVGAFALGVRRPPFTRSAAVNPSQTRRPRPRMDCCVSPRQSSSAVRGRAARASRRAA